MHADASATPDNVATIAFDVVIDADVIDGTVISNQGFVSAVGGGVSDQPSDDPRTPIADDPTRDVVGDSPLLFAPKSVELLFDAGAPGIVDPGDVLHYTITVYNSGNVAATGVELADSVPANTSYLDDSTTLNGLPVGDPVAGTSPLETGIPISSSDLTPPLPGAGEGTLSAGASAVIEFNLEVDADVPGGTIISNRWGRQPRDGARAHGGGGRRRATALDRQAGDGGRRWCCARRLAARVRRARHQHRSGSRLRHRHHRRPGRADAGASHVRRRVGDAGWLDDRCHGRGSGHHRQLLEFSRPVAAG
jgi:uncharacterized repeat protein (TIGR01451 family)